MKRWIFLLLCSILSAKEPERFLSVAAIFKNESPYLKEWIEYHKLVGVQHFYLYNNDSQDDYYAVLAPYIAAKEVTLIEWPNRPADPSKTWSWVFATQVTAYEQAIIRAKGHSKWLALIDIDEFLVPVREQTMVSFLKQCEQAQPNLPAVHILWEMHGTSNVQSIPKESLMIDLLRKKAFPDHPLNKVGKTILKPDCYQKFAHPPHTCYYINNKQYASISKKDCVINHYSNKSIDYFYNHKIRNKELMDNVKYSQEIINELAKLGNDIEDPNPPIARFIPELKKKMGAL